MLPFKVQPYILVQPDISIKVLLNRNFSHSFHVSGFYPFFLHLYPSYSLLPSLPISLYRSQSVGNLSLHPLGLCPPLSLLLLLHSLLLDEHLTCVKL